MTNPLEVLKFCPRCGSGLFPPFCSRSLRCADCGFHFYVNSATAVAGLIFNQEGELLLTTRAVAPAKGMLDLPGGFVDPGERAEDALQREVLEELNLRVDEANYLVTYPNEYIFSGYTVFTCDIGYVCRVRDFTGIHSNDDISGYCFIRPSDIDFNKICSNSIRFIIKHYIECFRQGTP